jgi:hypothetical protein
MRQISWAGPKADLPNSIEIHAARLARDLASQNLAEYTVPDTTVRVPNAAIGLIPPTD